MLIPFTPAFTLDAYANGLFPMAQSADAPDIEWICPHMRGQLSITDIHIPRRLRKTIRTAPYKITINNAFADVIDGCAAPQPHRQGTWINQSIRDVFTALHAQGHAHSLEVWDAQNQLIGGIYGLALGGVFCGESMFSRARDASKIALIHLTARLWKAGFTLFDTQFTNDHLEQFGVYEIAHDDYMKRLSAAIHDPADFTAPTQSPTQIMQDYFTMRGF